MRQVGARASSGWLPGMMIPFDSALQIVWKLGASRPHQCSKIPRGSRNGGNGSCGVQVVHGHDADASVESRAKLTWPMKRASDAHSAALELAPCQAEPVPPRLADLLR